jgi:hypothetical protein
MWQRPWAFWAFLLPVLVLLLARSPLRPHRVATGALSLWRRVEESAHAAGGERPKLPPALLCLVIGLFLGVLSLAGPRELSGGTSRTWQIVVDRSPSAYLSSAGSKLTRLDAALALLESRLSDELRSGDSLRWFDGSEWLGGSEVPSSWISAPRVALSAPRWEEQDLPGVIWVCPVEPESERRAATLCAGGAEVSPGAVALDGQDRLDWDRGDLKRVIGGAPQRTVMMSGVEGRFADFVTLWAEERGLLLNRSEGGAQEVLRVSVGSSGEDWGAEAWKSRPGLLLLSSVEGPTLGGDPAQFALTWSELLDTVCLPPIGFSPVWARSLSGDEAWELGEVPGRRSDGSSQDQSWGAWMALLACGFVAAALIAAPR